MRVVTEPGQIRMQRRVVLAMFEGRAMAIDGAKLDEIIKILEVAHNCAVQRGVRSEEIYQRANLSYYRKLRSARAEGKPIVAISMLEPAELLEAMDIVPLRVEYIGPAAAVMTGNTEEPLNAARAFGYRAESCSIDRYIAGAFLLGWLPMPDAYVRGSMVCDATFRRGDVVGMLFNCPTFDLDVPYHDSASALEYYLKQMKELVAFLETIGKCKMDLVIEHEAIEQSGADTEGVRSKLESLFERLGNSN